ncbi:MULTISPECIES: tRNA (adenosine(37)-N6)-threonylcarbamoyltransferase complex ATPase subunit type 1 TsaE [Enterococcus]|uniref:tRNA (adenosine(37)-N6)-threonylcarbamoyltransferase complex ATPase subunit type 1 TsaE n=1 Tax=Enterococcus TaxID=1350 RepID=UPI0010F816D2|nr:MULTISPECIES: tRNA (adenosine(37)-N6)-threonylcarbamoyltransferase complex ATPase subunit type 1 TsaE [Enterococcus]KAF1300783.1 tRNA (N6-adenosine(37)-N6)-threonylcarbamoyltransferase complex ATPase TsaE [Enterococcus sp. JM9B]
MMTLKNPIETETLAEVIGRVAQAGDNLVLTGDLGAGKTTLTKGIAKGLGITQMIKSPTYTIIREYPDGRLPLYHMDVYRVEYGADDLGLDEYFEGDGLSVIEWGNMLKEALPQDYLELILLKDQQDLEKRTFQLKTFGPQAEAFKTRILAEWTKEDA